MEVPQNTENMTTIQSTPVYLSEENRNSNLKRYLYPNVHSTIIYYTQDMETTYLSINGWMDKEEVIYNEILFSQK